ncbi:hypothetical protein [Wolbachia endosymbiont (group A) of Pogonocherus hispidulus]|uniref:hypothetical protein n=1 Tax=Wolbachia endosymbiont (group A) of Pogonocherus hispidulus TaxID=3066136 RepID=UPI00333FCC40
MEKISKRIDDKEIMHLIKLILKVGGKQGIAQGSPVTPPTTLQIFLFFSIMSRRVW